jgi:hypothetical protein
LRPARKRHRKPDPDPDISTIIDEDAVGLPDMTVRTLLRTFTPPLLLAGALALGSCGSSTTSPASDMAAPPDALAAADSALDQSMPADQAAVDDLAVEPDLLHADTLPAGCRSDNDCRLFSSYCETAPCQCIPLPAGAPDPVCNGRMVTCLFDPCMKKKAVCDGVRHECTVGQI